MRKWMSASDRVTLVNGVVTEVERQFQIAQYKSVLREFGVETDRAGEYLFYILMEDADDDSLAALGRHFRLETPSEHPLAPKVTLETERNRVEVNNQEMNAVTEGVTENRLLDVDAYAELISAETALRAIIRLAVPNWMNDLNSSAVASLEAKLAEEAKRRDGIQVSQDLLDYTEIYELQTIINKHWDAVKPILDDKKRTDVYLGIIFDVRNSIGHSRPVYGAERLLLAGAAGQIRNQLARYKAHSDGPQRHYPSLDSARDSMETLRDRTSPTLECRMGALLTRRRRGSKLATQ
ncbi:hypothetical protein [Mycolicibacterium fluoranthenivorans]|uniref:hypothetical protein n=1 Tax=Mycolicibacterium fluoranthenivorans TaxID=258505 RepID=UPI0011136C11|nr:hypothetical protein [Mycolicibacterium fluoranthenivorans]